MKKERHDHIDVLRSIAILGMMATHVLSFNLGTPLYHALWNYVHFVVVAFVLCSGYLMIRQKKLNFLKRLKKLILPFYIYVLVHYLLWWLFPQDVSGIGLQKSWSFVLQTVLFIGGIDASWLPLLFIELTLLLPILRWLSKRKILLISYLLFSLIFTVFIPTHVFSFINYRWIMWIPWSLILCVGFLFSLRENEDTFLNQSKYQYLLFGSICLAMFFLLSAKNFLLHQTIILYDHKYPPDFFYLSYATGISSIVFFLTRLNVWKIPIIKSFNFFISANSYSLFFIHYIVLDVLVTKLWKGMNLSVPIQFLTVVIVSLLIAKILNLVQLGQRRLLSFGQLN